MIGLSFFFLQSMSLLTILFFANGNNCKLMLIYLLFRRFLKAQPNMIRFQGFAKKNKLGSSVTPKIEVPKELLDRAITTQLTSNKTISISFTIIYKSIHVYWCEIVM
ncbi:hypothetical protein EDC94DRAFT_626421, partial [Helicostylum pulchrum]